MKHVKSIGRYTYGQRKIAIKNWGHNASLTIGSFCSIANDITVFLGGNHRTEWITTFPFGHIFVDELGGADIKGHPATNGDVIIGNDVWLGTGVTIMSGITIGNGAVVAANTTVVKNVDPYSIVGGNPGRHIKYRFDPDIINELLELSWWNLDVEIIKKIIEPLSSNPSKESIAEIRNIINEMN